MSLTRYVAKWGWASLFVLTWVTVLDWWAGPPTLLFAAFCIFGSITALSTGLYIFGVFNLWKYMRKGYTMPYE